MNEIALVLIAAGFHEVGHLWGALLTGSRIDRIGINWHGPYLTITVDPPCRWKAITNLMAGPAANLLCGLAGGTFGFISVAMGLLNLILPGSDGMQAIRVWRKK